jgi:hypothetical protein
MFCVLTVTTTWKTIYSLLSTLATLKLVSLINIYTTGLKPDDCKFQQYIGYMPICNGNKDIWLTNKYTTGTATSLSHPSPLLEAAASKATWPPMKGVERPWFGRLKTLSLRNRTRERGSRERVCSDIVEVCAALTACRFSLCSSFYSYERETG